MTTALSYVYRFEPGADPAHPPLLLLHGTGGDEEDLLPLGREVAPSASLLSPRGNVLEGAMPRFFRRIGEGRFDEDDVRRRANELADFLARRGAPIRSRRRLRSAIPTAPISPPRFSCCARRRLSARFSCERWRRSPIRRKATCPESRS